MTELGPRRSAGGASRRRPSARVRRRRRGLALILLGVTVISGAAILVSAAVQPAIVAVTERGSTVPDSVASPSAIAAPAPASPSASPSPSVAQFDMGAQSTTDPTSSWVIVNKTHEIAGASSFVPTLGSIPSSIPNPNQHQLRPDVVEALVAMSAAAKAEVQVTLIAQSGYRSYSTQVGAFQYYVDSLGVTAAELTSARPGFSEHQTGLAIDILDTKSGCSIGGPCFGETAAGQWLVANAHRFGFILRYPADKTAITGYEYEPWHFRFVGVGLATEMQAQGITTLEEFFSVPGGSAYK